VAEDGAAFVRFVKPLYDALLLAPLTHTQLLVALCVVRWTLGHRNRVEERISPCAISPSAPAWGARPSAML
jgi:hypothetical protein